MNKNTILTYSAAGKSFSFALDGPIWLVEASGISENEVGISETQGANQVGSTLGGQTVQPRSITLNGLVRRDLEANRRAVLDCVLPCVPGRLSVTQNGESWYIDCVPKRTPQFTDGSAVQRFQIALHCPYPYFRSSESGDVRIAGMERTFRFPRSLAGRWYLGRYTDSLFTTVRNTGNIPAEIDVEFEAMTEVETPEIYHVEKGAFIRINRTMPPGEKITVSTVYGRTGVTLRDAGGNESNGFRYLDIRSDLFMKLLPGENTLRYDAAKNREGLQVTVRAPKGVLAGL